MSSHITIKNTLTNLKLYSIVFSKLWQLNSGILDPFINHDHEALVEHLKIPILQSLGRTKELLF